MLKTLMELALTNAKSYDTLLCLMPPDKYDALIDEAVGKGIVMNPEYLNKPYPKSVQLQFGSVRASVATYDDIKDIMIQFANRH